MRASAISTSHQTTDVLGLDFILSQGIVPHCGALPCPPLTSFIGRQKEMAEVKRLLVNSRLLTLTGPGGCGKTRLAFQVATTLVEEFEQSVCWVELAGLTDPAQVPQAVASALSIRRQESGPLTDTLTDGQHTGKLLLVWDNCEHLVAACAQLAGALLGAYPNLQILTTSREALHIVGETAWLVPPLCQPNFQHASSLNDLVQCESVQLFIERARAVQPSFTLTQEHAQAVAQVCYRLDGIPLAIELAAARVKVLSVTQIAARLDDCCRLLTDGSRTALSRQQTLRATIDWSYDLLSEQERTLFRRLSVFVGSFPLEAAEAVCIDEQIAEDEILDLLSHLVDKSLVTVKQDGSETQYRMLETIQQYGQDKLQEVGEAASVRKRCRDWHLGVAKCEVKPSLSVGTVSSTVKVQPELRLFALGPARVYRGKTALTPADWRYIKAGELLFYLLSHRARTKEQIGLALWPEASTAQLRSNFHATLHHLRRALGRSEWILFEKDRYTFNRQLAYHFDAEALESHLSQARNLQAQAPTQAIHYLEKAVKLYQGDFLEDMLDSDWVLLRQKEVRQMYLDALQTLGQLLFVQEQYEQAAHAYRQLIALDSFLEGAHRELMRCYARQGERSQALRHYQTLATMLRNELGSAPAPETTAIFACLHRGEAC